jgi:hypothetical protein
MANYYRSKITCLYAPPSAVAMIRIEICRRKKAVPRRHKTRKTVQGMARARLYDYITIDNLNLHANSGSYRDRLKYSLLLPQPQLDDKARVAMERQLHVAWCLWYNDTLIHKV